MVFTFPQLLLRSYHDAIGWNIDNHYTNLALSSSAILDFSILPTLSLQLSNKPTGTFFTSYSLDALPQLHGSISYIASSRELDAILPSDRIPLKTVIEHFRIFPPPRRPTPPDEQWLAGDLLAPSREYLLYSRLHLPSLHLSGLATTKLAPTWQASLAFLHQPPISPAATQSSSQNGGFSSSSSSSSSAHTPTTPTTPIAPSGNLILTLQRDTGRYSTEYSYSVTDGMFGLKGLYNFGLSEAQLQSKPIVQRRIDEEEAMDTGLRGRFSAGGEIYFSAKQRSLGVSTGLRFTTLPGSASPPTTLTLLYNPLMGFISTAYSAQITPHLALSSRYGLNVYSYESDLTIGGEWWIGSGRGKGGWRGLNPTTGRAVTSDPNDRDGVLKARLSGTGLVSLLYESRIRQCIVSIGVISDLSSRSSPISSIGLGVQYMSG